MPGAAGNMLFDIPPKLMRLDLNNGLRRFLSRMSLAWNLLRALEHL